MSADREMDHLEFMSGMIDHHYSTRQYATTEEQEVEIELDLEERATITANQWIRTGAKILGFPNGEIL